MIEHDVRQSLNIVMAGYRRDRQWQQVAAWSVNGDDAVNATIQKQLRVFVQQVRLMTMAGDDIKIARLQQLLFDSAHDFGSVAAADFRHQHSERMAAPRAKAAREKMRAVVEAASGFKDAIL